MSAGSSWSQDLYKRRARSPRQSSAGRARTSSDAMCRVTLLVFLCVGAAAAAAQASDGTLLVGDDTRLNLTTDLGYSLENLPTLAAESTTRPARQSDATAEPERPEPTTEPDALATTTSARSFTKPSPRFISKLGYFNRANTDSFGSVSTNLVERPDGDGKKRRFKSRCRCEKIWNCPKLQITVPRCPDEYFLCCF